MADKWLTHFLGLCSTMNDAFQLVAFDDTPVINKDQCAHLTNPILVRISDPF